MTSTAAMTKEIAVKEKLGQDLALDELAAIANREHEAGALAAGQALRHWMAAGDALLASKTRVGWGEWVEWLRDNFYASPALANHYMRLATYREQIEAVGITDTKRAYSYLRGLPRVVNALRPEGVNSEAVEEARRLTAGGVSKEEAARLLGVTSSTVRYWLDPQLREKKCGYEARRRREARAKAKAEREVARERAIQRIKGPGAEAYSFLRRAAQMLDRAAAESGEREARIGFNAALAQVAKAEDEVVRALGVST